MRILAGLLGLFLVFCVHAAFTGDFNQAVMSGVVSKAVQAVQVQERCNVLILGVDSPDTKRARPDLIMLVQINPGNQPVRIISIPRDTRVKVEGVGYTKINHANVIGEARGGEQLGTQLTSDAVSNLLGTQVDYYVKLDVQGFRNIIDSMGGLDLELAKPVKLTDFNRTLPAGRQHLNGEETLKLVQERYSLEGGDFDRQRNQFMVLQALTSKFNGSAGTRQLTELVRQMRKSIIATDLTTSKMTELALFVSQVKPEDIAYYQVPGQAAYEYDPLLKTRLYYWKPDIAKLRNTLK